MGVNSNRELTETTGVKMNRSTSAISKDAQNLPDMGPSLFSEVSWKGLVAAMAAFGTVGGIVLHVLGYVFHQTYLSTWNIDTGLFPKSMDDTAMAGYYAFMDRSVNILSAVIESAYLLIGFALMLFVATFIALHFGKSGEKRKLAPRVRCLPEWMRDFAVSLVASAGTVAMFPLALIVLISILLIPAAGGEAVGKQVAKNQQEKFLAGCGSEFGRDKCIELRREGKVVARGFLIDSSTTHVAVYDVEEKRPRVIERAGTEFVARSHSSGNK